MTGKRKRALRPAVPTRGFERVPVRTTSVVLRQLFDVVHEGNYSYRSVADTIGVAHSNLTHWKSGTSNPSLLAAEEFASVLGYKLMLVKMEGE